MPILLPDTSSCYTVDMKKSRSGFTIVELLIVIVVIAILAAITIVAYRGIQARARDSQRKQDVTTIRKALELYYIDQGVYPNGQCLASCKINPTWSTTSDGSWATLEALLVPRYLSKLPTDPMASTSTPAGISGGFNYDYTAPGSWCSVAVGQMYLLSYRLENSAQEHTIAGNCAGNQPFDYASSEYMQVKS